MSKENTVSLWEISDRLENLHSDLSIAGQTLTAIEAGLSEGHLDGENIIWAR